MSRKPGALTLLRELVNYYENTNGGEFAPCFYDGRDVVDIFRDIEDLFERKRRKPSGTQYKRVGE